MRRKSRIGFISLGCPKNQVDTEVMLAEVASAGYEITPEDSEADIIIVNTCAFIESAKRESIDEILDVAWLKKNANLKGIIVTGCLAERYREQIFEELPEVDAVLGVGGLHHIVDAIRSVEEKKRFSNYDCIGEMAMGGDRVVTTPGYLAYLKIAEGCSNRCTYCAIPMIRGALRSRPIENLVREAKEMEALGTRELVLVAQDTSSYGIDLYGSYRLPELIRAITEQTQIPWIRVLYCYPDKISDELIAEFRDNPRLVRYLDLPIQHTVDRILRKMNRHGGSDVIFDAVRRLRSVPGMILRSTCIVGFPGETEADFTQLCEDLKKLDFDRLGVFPYSREEDTPAFDFPDQVDPQVAQDRADLLMGEQAERNRSRLEKQTGSVVTVLNEAYDPVSGMYFGRTYADAYEIDGKVFYSVPSGKRKIAEGEFVRVKITDCMGDYDLIGEIDGASL
ncbi:MAG: 30S ribosomal protein S12 methylthiotransferase RimO [Candidatus Methanomethylophilaceae archaeon]|nr:30S ribosomal protein S12 methylthiotransferase RimO [Candidatus Methanomethylophilaceae archaeon]